MHQLESVRIVVVYFASISDLVLFLRVASAARHSVLRASGGTRRKVARRG